MLSLAVDVDGQRLDSAHIVAVELSVDGLPWGRFDLDGAPPEGWTFTAEDSRFVRAVVGDATDLPVPETLGDWGDLHTLTLAAGAHVAQVTGLYLRNGAGDEISLSSSQWTPFRTALGDDTAWLGEQIFTLESLP